MKKVEMEWKGEGTKPANIKVYENEVDDLEKAGGWKRVKESSKSDKKEEVKNG